jgi:PAS domain S-box-containing protein
MTKILIADDDSQNLYLLESLLKAYEFEVTSAGNGAEALELARKNLPDLVVTDIFMPVMDGFKLCLNWKSDKQLRNIPLIFYTATYTDPKDEEYALSLGAERFLVKPQEPEALIGVIRQVLADRGKQRSEGHAAEEAQSLRQYSEVLFRKLEGKVLQLESEIAERKHAEEILRESEAKFRSYIESAPLAIFVADREGRLVDFNLAAVDLLGCDADILRNMHIVDLHPEDERERVLREFATLLETGHVETEIRVKKCNGQIIWVSLHVVMTSDRLSLGYCQDITERRLMQEQITSAAQQWQATFDSIQDQVMILDREFRIIRVNAAAVAFLGLPLSRILNGRCHNLMHGTDVTVVGCPVEMTFRTGLHAEAEIFHEGKNVWLLVSADPILDSAGNVTRVVHTVKEITLRKKMDELLQSKLMEIENLKMQLEQENISLRDEVKFLSPHAEIVAQSPAMQQILVQVQQVAPTDSTVLITGETGTGKELIARAIHSLSKRKALPMVTVNCASLPPSLIESELFGREKGAYTGAMSRMVGRFEIADGSTILLDEIGDLPLEVQAKLLRVLEERRFERLGSTKPISVNVRIVASTNRDLERMVQTDKFRVDLFYRLNVFPIAIPPLRERPEDIPPLTWSFIHYFEKRMGKHIQSIPTPCLEALVHYAWPGNARELRNFIEHAMIVNTGTSLELRPPVLAPQEMFDEGGKLEDLERRHILRVLEASGWRVSARGGAADVLGLKPTTLEARMKKLGIRRP